MNKVLKSLVSYKSAFQLLKLWSVVIIAAVLISSSVSFYYMISEIKRAKSLIWVLDKNGNISSAEESSMYDPKTRIFEFEDHLRKFYRLWYGLDEGSFKRNTDEALHLVGQCGKELYNEYKETDLLRKLQEGNLKSSVEIERIEIDMNASPVSGLLYGIQTVRRPKGQGKRRLDAEFILYDVERSRENPHGVLIEGWRIINSDKIEEK